MLSTEKNNVFGILPHMFIHHMKCPLTHLPLCRIYASVNRVSIGLDNGLSPIRRQAINWTNAGLLSIEALGTNLTEIWIEIVTFSFKKMRFKMSIAKMAAIFSRGTWVNQHISDIVGCRVSKIFAMRNMITLVLHESASFFAIYFEIIKSL